MVETGFEPISQKWECIAQTIVPLGVLIIRSCFYLLFVALLIRTKKTCLYSAILDELRWYAKNKNKFHKWKLYHKLPSAGYFHMWDPSLVSETMEFHKWRKTLVHCGIIPFSLKNYWQQYWYNYDTQEHNHSPATNS